VTEMSELRQVMLGFTVLCAHLFRGPSVSILYQSVIHYFLSRPGAELPDLACYDRRVTVSRWL